MLQTRDSLIILVGQLEAITPKTIIHPNTGDVSQILVKIHWNYSNHKKGTVNWGNIGRFLIHFVT